METKHLRTFVSIVELSSFTRAGVKLGLSQSAISQQIGALERQLGVKLLRRTGSGARPTAAGELLLDHARQILSRVDNARRLLSEYDSSAGGVLRIGAGGAACRRLLPEVLVALRETSPRLELHVRSGHSDLTLERLLDGEIDVGILTLPTSHPKLRLVDLAEDELVVVVAPSHAWARRACVLPVELGTEPLLVCERKSRTFQLVERVLLEAGVFPRVAMEIDHLEAVSRMVAHGLGIAVVPRWAVGAETDRGELVALPVGPRGLKRRWAAGFLEEPRPRQALRIFVRLCAEQLPTVLAADSVPAPERRAAAPL